jgi:hypothetical protein
MFDIEIAYKYMKIIYFLKKLFLILIYQNKTIQKYIKKLINYSFYNTKTSVVTGPNLKQHILRKQHC